MPTRLVLTGVILMLCGSVLTASPVDVSSPDGKIKVNINNGRNLSFQIFHCGKVVTEPSAIGMQLNNGTVVNKVTKIEKAKKESQQIDAPLYRQKSFETSFNKIRINLNAGFGVEFRVYNEGMAYRFYYTQKRPLTIKNEISDFNFPQDRYAYLPYTTNKKKPFAMAFQNIYQYTMLNKADTLPAFLPVTVDCGEGLKVTLLESDLESYPGMFVRAEGNGLKGVFAPYPTKTDYYPWRQQEYVTDAEDCIAHVKGARTFPWRVFAVTEKDADMPVNNLVYALASPNRTGNTSWIKAGQVAWDWWNDWGLKGVDFKAGINQRTYKYYIDFASHNHIPYIILDEGWYNPKSGNMLEVIPELNLPELVSYAKSKGVDIILWTVFNVLDSQLEEACSKYAAMGIKGFKVDFLDRDDQTAVEMTYRIAAATARHHLLLDLHGFYKPTGLNRTYPNIINFESVFGMEEMKWNNDKKDMPLYDVTFPYIRMMAGPVDYTPGAMRNGSKTDYQPIYYNPMSMGTRCHQLATYIVFDSPLTMLADSPTSYEKEQECTDFITSIPTTVDETRILSGELGKYIVSARRKGNDWYVGGLTNWDARDIHLDFSFLKGDGSYTVTILKDGVNADKQAEDYHKEIKTVDRNTKWDVHMASGGGFAMKIKQ